MESITSLKLATGPVESIVNPANLELVAVTGSSTTVVVAVASAHVSLVALECPA